MKKPNNSSIFTPYFIIVAFLATLTTVSTLILSSSSSHAETSSVLASVTVPDVCTIAADNSSTAHTDTVGVGEYKANIGETVFNITCNDNNGYSIYAVGYSNNTVGNTNLIGTTNGATIPTGTSTVTGSSAVSNWAMKLTAVSGTFPATILDSYDSYHVVPSTATKIATRTSSIDLSEDSKIKTTYAVSISPAQTADSYVGKVKYTVVHPNYANADGSVPQPLYNIIAAMSKGKQTAAQLQATITVPTSANRTQDTSNSGVYEYDASVFGTSSDASNDYKIYYYRGVLENTVGSYGSDGSAVTYPNYVILQAGSSKATTDTCWRIVRTTGSGGIKMIYNGKWTGSTCANAATAAQVTTEAFNGTLSTYRQIVRVGYTYNSTYATNTAKSGTIAQIFGTNSTPTVNDTRSDIKTYIEDTWYASNMTAWTSKLEASAGYCNDRTMNTTDSWTSPLAESSTIAATYGTSGLQAYYFGAYPRNANAAQKPSLTCAKYSNVDRSTVDLYRYVANSTGVSNQLKYPAALLTDDEVSFAGSGSYIASNGSGYNANSYLRSGPNFWLLSPYSRDSYGRAIGFLLGSGGSLGDTYVYNTYGVRPAISLVSGTTISGGSGIATDPWVVTP